MRRSTIFSTVVLGGLVWSGFAAGAEDADGLKKQKQTLEAQISKDNDQLREIRHALAKGDDLAEATKAVADARKAMEDKVAADAKLAEVKKGAIAAEKAVRDAMDLTATSTEVVAAQKQVTAAEEAAEDVQSQMRIAMFTLNEVKRKVARDPELKKLLAAVAKAETRYHEASKENKQVETVDAKGARDAAQKAYEDALAAKLPANAEAAALQKKIQELEQQAKESQAAVREANKKFMETKDKVAKSDPNVIEARKAAEVANGTYRKAVNEATATEQAAVEAAQKKLTEKMEAKLAADPKAAAIRKELDDLNKQARDVSDQLHKLETPAKGEKTI